MVNADANLLEDVLWAQIYLSWILWLWNRVCALFLDFMLFYLPCYDNFLEWLSNLYLFGFDFQVSRISLGWQILRSLGWGDLKGLARFGNYSICRRRTMLGNMSTPIVVLLYLPQVISISICQHLSVLHETFYPCILEMFFICWIQSLYVFLHTVNDYYAYFSLLF